MPIMIKMRTLVIDNDFQGNPSTMADEQPPLKDYQEKKIKNSHLCLSCSLTPFCLPMGLNDDDSKRLDEVIERRKILKKGDYLYRKSHSFNALYAVRSGSVKTFTLNAAGQEQVMGFHLPGELIGLDGIYSKQHLCSAITLETSSVCVIPYPRLTSLSREIPGLQEHLLRVLSLNYCQGMAMHGDYTSEERLAAFLLGLSERFKRRGFSATTFHLSMSRSDIGNYLCLATETVSRLFARFHKEGIIEVDRRQISLLNPSRLEAVAANIISTSQA